MGCSYFTEPVVTRIYAYYKFVYSVPTTKDLVSWREKLNGINQLRYDNGFRIKDYITRDGESIHITREVSRGSYFLFFTIVKDESDSFFTLFTKDLGKFNINEIDKLKGE